MTQDIEGRRQCFSTIEPPWTTVVGRVGCDEVRKETFILATDLGPGHFRDTDPGALDNGSTVGFKEGAVDGGYEGFGIRSILRECD